MAFSVQIVSVTVRLLVCAAISVSASAAEMPAKSRIPFSTYDKDGNGLISEQEYASVRQQQSAGKAVDQQREPGFRFMDRNGDGQLTAGEFSAGQNTPHSGKAMPVDPYDKGKAMPVDPLGKGKAMPVDPYGKHR